jgi:sterol desaturase/sphingolipid hydroxylase (fatty acid hydroxylase superfamily)
MIGQELETDLDEMHFVQDWYLLRLSYISSIPLHCLPPFISKIKKKRGGESGSRFAEPQTAPLSLILCSVISDTSLYVTHIVQVQRK